MSKRIVLSLALLVGAAVSLGAQTHQESFFLKDHILAYRFNPALAPDGDFLAAGVLNYQDRRNYGLSSYMYPVDGKLATFLHPSVSAEDFASRIQADNYFLKAVNYNIISYGIRREDVMHTFEFNLRGYLGTSIPGEALKFVKNGSTASSLQLGRLRGQLDIYLEFAYGYSWRISDQLSVGGRVKLLAGMYGVDYQATRLDLTMSEEQYQARIEAQLDMTDKLMSFSAGESGYLDWRTFLWKGIGNLPSGGGAAIDLGISYEPVENLVISASMLDLGGIFWYYGNAATSAGTVTFAGFQDLAVEDMNMDGIKAQFAQVKDDALRSLKLTPAANKYKWKAIPLALNAGVKYALPFYDALTVGVTGNYTAFQWMPYWETRFGVGVNPVDWLDVIANLGTGSYGMVWGMAGSLKWRQFRFHLGLENGFGGSSPDSRRPLKANNKFLSLGIAYEL